MILGLSLKFINRAMASCTDLSKLSSDLNQRTNGKAPLAPIIFNSGRKFIEPFHRLKSRANLLRRKNYSSQLDLNSYHTDHRSSIAVDHIVPADHSASSRIDSKDNVTLLKRSNSMVCPQNHFQTLLKIQTNPQRNSLISETNSTPQATRLSVRRMNPTMSYIDENEILSTEHDENLTESSKSIELVRFRAEAPVIRAHRQSNCKTLIISERQSICSSIDEPFYDCQQSSSQTESVKVSICTMTGQSLENLLPSTSSEEKAVQTNLKSTESSTSLSSLSSNPTDSLENKSKPLKQQHGPINRCHSTKTNHKWPHLQEKLLGQQTCTYWVNYLGSTAIKISTDNPMLMATNAIKRLKHSTQYARILPIIGLSISSRGVEFLKHTKDRTVICFHSIKTINCACQDQDLRYFAYVTREQRLAQEMPIVLEKENPVRYSPSINLDYHHYCHVFVVKSESMSTEIMLTFGQAFDLALRIHQRTNDKTNCQTMSPSIPHQVHSPNRIPLPRAFSHLDSSSSSSPTSSIEERKIYI